MHYLKKHNFSYLTAQHWTCDSIFVYYFAYCSPVWHTWCQTFLFKTSGKIFPLQILWNLLQMYTLHATKYISHNVTECMYHVPALVTQRSYEPTHLRKNTSHFPMLGGINGGSVCANTYYAAVMTYIPIYYGCLNHIINNTQMCILWVKDRNT